MCGPLVGRGRKWVNLVWLVTYLVDNGMRLGGRVTRIEEFGMCLGGQGPFLEETRELLIWRGPCRMGIRLGR